MSTGSRFAGERFGTFRGEIRKFLERKTELFRERSGTLEPLRGEIRNFGERVIKSSFHHIV